MSAAVHKTKAEADPDARLRGFGWEVYSRPICGPALWWHRQLNIVKPQSEALAWCDQELKRVERS